MIPKLTTSKNNEVFKRDSFTWVFFAGISYYPETDQITWSAFFAGGMNTHGYLSEQDDDLPLTAICIPY